MAASDNMQLYQMFKEMKDMMITPEILNNTLTANNATLQHELQQSVNSAINSAIEKAVRVHIDPLIQRQRDMETKFDAILKRLEACERMVTEKQEQTVDGPTAKRRASGSVGPAREPTASRHLPSTTSRHPILDRTLKLTNFPSYLTHDDLLRFVQPLLFGANYERITSQRPRAKEVSVVFRSRSDAETFHASARLAANPVYTDTESQEATTLCWNRPTTAVERRRSFLVRKLKVQLPVWTGAGTTVEANQHNGRVFLNCYPLVTIAISVEDEIKYFWNNATITKCKLDAGIMEAYLREQCSK
jgi:hypothetical protein